MKVVRDLTPGEIKFANYIFKGSINCRNVKIRETIFQNKNAVAPFGSIYFPKEDYQEDYIGSDMYNPPDVENAHWFLHELTHVWQHSIGIRVILRGIKIHLQSLGKNHQAIYGYKIKKGTDLMDYTIEQQGDIIADYFGDKMWFRGIMSTRDVYEDVLENFLLNPMYPTNGKPLRKLRSGLRRLDR